MNNIDAIPKKRVEEIPPVDDSRKLDVFRMKAITAIQGSFPTIQAAIKSIHESPIYPVSQEDPNTLFLEQMHSPFPGKTIVVRGVFKNSTPPLPERFEVYIDTPPR